MFVIQSTNPEGWRWLSGIFERRAAAASEWDAIPEQTRRFHKIVEVRTRAFPLFIIEDHGFECVSLPQVLDRLKALQPKGDEDYIHLNVYAVRSEFKPSAPGLDEMGGLVHWHVTDDTLRPPRAAVFKAELQEAASDA